MPVYTYRCENCGFQFDRFQKFTENALTRCPECGKKSLRKVYSPVGIVFKGSGFYSTDHRSPSGMSHKPAVKNGESSSSSESSTPAEAPAASESKKSESDSKT
jgi:putative FmdB family regulatory protein